MNQVVIRSKDQYWRDYILEGIRKKLPKEVVKNQLLDAFRKEMFELICLRTDASDLKDIPETLKNKKTIENIARQAQNKWVSLCIMCAQYKETHGLIMPSDIESIKLEEDA